MVLFIQLAFDVLSHLEEPMNQVLVNSPNVSDNSLQVLSVLLDLTKIIIDSLHTRLKSLIDDPNREELLKIVELLLRFIVFGLVSQKPTEETIKNMTKSSILQEIINFISDFINYNICFYFNDQKYHLSLSFPIEIAASITFKFPKCAESFLIEMFTKVFVRAINECKMVCYFRALLSFTNIINVNLHTSANVRCILLYSNVIKQSL